MTQTNEDKKIIKEFREIHSILYKQFPLYMEEKEQFLLKTIDNVRRQERERALVEYKEAIANKHNKYNLGRVLKGLCIDCDKPKITAVYCKNHRDKNNEDRRRRYATKKVNISLKSS